MPGQPVGSIFAEIGIDYSPATRAQEQLLRDATSTALNVETNFKNLGVTSAQTFDLMRAKAVNSFEMIAASSKSTADDIVRAEQAKTAQLMTLNEQQFGKQTTLLEGLKANWLAASAAVVAAWALASKGMAFVEMAAKAEQAADSFKLVGEASRINSDALLANLQRAAAGTVADSDIMQTAVKGMVLGLSDTQLVTIMENARVAARYAGTDVQTAFQDITNAIGTDMPRALRQYGLITREETKQISEAIHAGATDVDLYSIAMAHAAVNTAKFGEAQTNAAERVQHFHADVKAAQESLGKGIIEAEQGFMAALAWGREWANLGAAWVFAKVGLDQEAEAMRAIAAEAAKTVNAYEGVAGQSAAAHDQNAKTLADAERALKLEQDKLKAASETAAQRLKDQEEFRKAIAETERVAKDATATQAILYGMQAALGTAERATATGMTLAGMTPEARRFGGGVVENAAAMANLGASQASSAARISDQEKTNAALKASLQGYLAQGLITWQDYTKQVTEMDQALTVAKLKSLDDYEKALIAALGRAVAEYTKYSDAVIAKEKEINAAKRTTATDLREISEASMTPANKLADRQKAAQDDLTAAMKLSGDEQVAALRQVQTAYKDIALEATKMAEEQAKAAAKTQDEWVSEMPGTSSRHGAGQTSPAWQKFWAQPTSGVGSADWWSEGALGPGSYVPPGTAGGAAGVAQTATQQVKSVGDLILAALNEQKTAAQSAADSAKSMVNSLTQAAQSAERLAKALASATPASPATPEAAAALLAAQAMAGQAPSSIAAQLQASIAVNAAASTMTPEASDLGLPAPIPSAQEGGYIPGPIGRATLIKAHGGELVLNPAQQRQAFGAGGRGGPISITIPVSLAGKSVGSILIPDLQQAIADRRLRVN